MDTFELKKVIVISDGSTDGTDRLVKELSLTNPKISLLIDGKRMGKSARLMSLYKSNNSDIFVQFDADVILANKNSLEELLKPFQNNRVVMVSGDKIPLSNNTFVAKLILKWHQIWRQVRISMRNIHTIKNSFSCILALRKEFAKSLSLDSNITSESSMIYYEVKKRHLLFKFAPKSAVFYKLPSTITDYLSQTRRSYDEEDLLLKKYGKKIYTFNNKTGLLKIRVVLKSLLTDPIYTILSIGLVSIIHQLPFNPYSLKKDGKWKTISTTKTVINSNQIV